MTTIFTTREELKNHVKKHDVVIVKFKAEWCGPCKKVAPHIKSLTEQFKNINYVEVDVDNGGYIASYL